jgi:hypothetical protein
MVRYFCVVAPGAVGDLGYDYLIAIAGIAKLRAIPIGPAAALGYEQRWWRASRLFTTPIDQPFVNVVCAMPGLEMGTRAPAHTMATKDGLPPELRAILGPDADRAAARHAKDGDDELVYEPKGAFAGLWTAKVKNIAITQIGAQPIAAGELVALAKYDLVICPMPADSHTLADMGLSAVHLAAHRPAAIMAAIEAVCGSAITATTAGSPDTGEPRATTSSRSTASTTSSSRSPSTATSSEVPSPATPPSIRSPDPTPRSWAGRTWRSITRLLGFSPPS